MPVQMGAMRCFLCRLLQTDQQRSSGLIADFVRFQEFRLSTGVHGVSVVEPGHQRLRLLSVLATTFVNARLLVFPLGFFGLGPLSLWTLGYLKYSVREALTRSFKVQNVPAAFCAGTA